MHQLRDRRLSCAPRAAQPLAAGRLLNATLRLINRHPATTPTNLLPFAEFGCDYHDLQELGQPWRATKPEPHQESQIQTAGCKKR